MGILNATPDSFSDGGQFLDTEEAIDHASQMIEQGAEIIDVGGESTRPGAQPVATRRQVKRTQPVIAGIHERHPDVAISIDTSSAEVAVRALECGASMVNDVSALRGDADMVDVIAESGCHVVLMHMQGTPRTMQTQPEYDNLMLDIRAFLMKRSQFASEHGICTTKIALDPGIGFGKTVAHNMTILSQLHTLCDLGPIVLGTSRKSFIGRILSVEDPMARRIGTAVTHVLGLMAGARILRVHDVQDAVDVLKMLEHTQTSIDT